ncbi:hypothetical protein [Leucothrix mucor]|uniref:hypothetical protein n=1 Tax=Leucothrix mucor TaxID=45248 RepID=UPI0003B4DE95|nr:hypothetical protein [Leucothrix mucor]
MMFRYLAPIVLIASVSLPQVVSANAIATGAAKKVASSDAAKVAMRVVTPAENSKAVHNLNMFIKAQAQAQVNAELQQKTSPITGGLSGGSRVGPRARE